MAIITQTNALNIRPGVQTQTVVHVSYGDVGSTLKFKIYNGTAEFDATGLTASVHGVRADGVGFGPYAVTVSVAEVRFNIRSAMTAVAGPALAEIVFSSNGASVGTANFALLVEQATFPEGPTYTNDVSVYQQILAYVQGAVIPTEAITIDSSLNIVGAAAEAKATGDAINALSGRVDTLGDTTTTLDNTVKGMTADNGIQPSQINGGWNAYKPIAGKKITGYNSTTKVPAISDDATCNYCVVDVTGDIARTDTVTIPIFSGDYAAVQLWDDLNHVLGSFSLGNAILLDPASYPTRWIFNFSAVVGGELVIDVQRMLSNANFNATKYIAFCFGGTGYVHVGGKKSLDWLRVKPAQIEGVMNLSDPVPGKTIRAYNSNTKKPTYNESVPGSCYTVLAMADVADATTVRVPLFPETNVYAAIQLWDGWEHVLSSYSADNTIMNNRSQYPTRWVWNFANIVGSEIVLDLDRLRNNSNFAATKYIAFSFAASTADTAYVISNAKKELEWLTVGEETKKDILAYVPNLLVADHYYAVVGKELNLYFNQIYECWNWEAMNIIPSIQYTGAGARVEDDRISIIPTAAGDFTLQIWTRMIVGGEQKIFKKTNITVTVVANAIPSTQKKVMFLGDSRTDYARLSKPAKAYLGEAIELVGTLETDGYKHEGRSGWTAQAYCTEQTHGGILNPFYNPSSNTFDFAYYLQETQVPVPNYVNILLGANGGYSDANVTYMDIMVKSIHDYDPTIVVTIMQEYALPTGCGYNTGALARRGLSLLHYNLIASKFGGRESEKIYVVEAGSAIDNFYDFPITTAAASQYNPTEKTVIRDSIHLLSYGYDKLISVWAAWYIAHSR